MDNATNTNLMSSSRNTAAHSPQEAPMATTTFAVLDTRSFGPFSRFRLDTVRSRFGALHFMVFDAERIDPVTDRPACIRQADTEAEAVEGLAD